jgi:hypothetical protein
LRLVKDCLILSKLSMGLLILLPILLNNMQGKNIQ